MDISPTIRNYLRLQVGTAVAKHGPKAQVSVPVQDLMSDDLVRFVEKAIEKFIKGQVEHGGDIRDRNLDHELMQETIDSFWYNSAKKWPSHIR